MMQSQVGVFVSTTLDFPAGHECFRRGFEPTSDPVHEFLARWHISTIDDIRRPKPFVIHMVTRQTDGTHMIRLECGQLVEFYHVWKIEVRSNSSMVETEALGIHEAIIELIGPLDRSTCPKSIILARQRLYARAPIDQT
jgi:hypothetical protein